MDRVVKVMIIIKILSLVLFILVFFFNISFLNSILMKDNFIFFFLDLDDYNG